jgi:tryptophanyl-tRNA synthetase
MATSESLPKSELTVPVAEQEQKQEGKQEQQIDPWSVNAGKDSQGNTLAFDYVAISK